MEEEKTTIESVPFIVHESSLARMERQVKRLFILCIVIFAAFVATNIGWVIYENSFQDVTLTQEATADNGSDLVVNGVGSGEVNYNGSESEADNKDKAKESP